MRVGIVGVGTIGQALARAIDRGEVAVQLTALHSRNLAKAQAFARTLGCVPEVVDLAGVIARCDLVQPAGITQRVPRIAVRRISRAVLFSCMSIESVLDADSGHQNSA